MSARLTGWHKAILAASLLVGLITVSNPPWHDYYGNNLGYFPLGEAPDMGSIDYARLGLHIAVIVAVAGIAWIFIPQKKAE